MIFNSDLLTINKTFPISYQRVLIYTSFHLLCSKRLYCIIRNWKAQKICEIYKAWVWLNCFHQQFLIINTYKRSQQPETLQKMLMLKLKNCILCQGQCTPWKEWGEPLKKTTAANVLYQAACTDLTWKTFKKKFIRIYLEKICNWFRLLSMNLIPMQTLCVRYL